MPQALPPLIQSHAPQELAALIQYTKIGKENDQDWFTITVDRTGVKWSGKCWLDSLSSLLPLPSAAASPVALRPKPLPSGIYTTSSSTSLTLSLRPLLLTQ